MFHYYYFKENFSYLEFSKVGKLVQIFLELAHTLSTHLDLLVLILDGGWHQSVDTQVLSLLQSESQTL